MAWKTGRGLLGPLKPLLGAWVSRPDAQETRRPMLCTRTLRAFGKGWVELDARWNTGPATQYREVALFGALSGGGLGFYSFTSDGKRCEGRLADGTDVHPEAIAFEAEMPAGVARMVYWPLDAGTGFNFAVESRSKAGWRRFLRQAYAPSNVSTERLSDEAP